MKQGCYYESKGHVLWHIPVVFQTGETEVWKLTALDSHNDWVSTMSWDNLAIIMSLLFYSVNLWAKYSATAVIPMGIVLYS
jgi:hypothetical protein